jgi:hypothetical protein
MLRALLVCLLFVSSCAIQKPQKAEAPPLRPAFDRLLIGTSTKADARAALGEATVVDFESGYEVWVYREQIRDKPPAEFVLLFEPSGILKKKRRK